MFLFLIALDLSKITFHREKEFVQYYTIYFTFSSQRLKDPLSINYLKNSMSTIEQFPLFFIFFIFD